MRTVLYICLLSSKSAIGDSFLDLIWTIPPEQRARVSILKTNVYNDNDFPPGLLHIYNQLLVRDNLTISGIKKFVLGVSKVNQDLKPSVILSYGNSPLNLLAAVLFRKSVSNYWLHDPDLHIGAALSERAAHIFMKIIARFSKTTRFLVSNDYLLNRTASAMNVDSHKIRVIPFPYISSIVKAKSPEECEFNAQSNILFFGRVEKYKGLDILLRVWADIEKINVNARLIVAGKGLLHINPVLKQVVHENKYVANERLHYLLKTGLACVFPYTSATGTQAVQTALALGLPCILSNLPCFKYISNQINGFGVYIYNNEDELRNLLARFVNGHISVDRSLLAKVAESTFSTRQFGLAVSEYIDSFV